MTASKDQKASSLDRYVRTLQAVRDGADTITGVAERLGMMRPTVETHFRWLREHRYIQGARAGMNLPAIYCTTHAGRTWLEAVACAKEAPPEQPDAPIVGEPDESLTATLYRWLRLSPPKPHAVRGRVHRLIDQESAG